MRDTADPFIYVQGCSTNNDGSVHDDSGSCDGSYQDYAIALPPEEPLYSAVVKSCINKIACTKQSLNILTGTINILISTPTASVSSYLFPLPAQPCLAIQLKKSQIKYWKMG
jgi:hypothetical protein